MGQPSQPLDTLNNQVRRARAVRIELWLRGILAAAIAGAAGGILTGFAAMGIAPDRFNFNTGASQMWHMTMAAAAINAVIGVAAYLQKSPLPPMNGDYDTIDNKPH